MSGIHVDRAPGWKCERCRRVLPEVGLCADHPDLCMRCVAVVAPDVDVDIHAWASARFDRLLGEELAAGHALQYAVRRAGARHAGVAQ